MPELPEITIIAAQAGRALVGRRFTGVEVPQPKCANLDPQAMSELLVGRSVSAAYARGKWVFMELEPDGHLLINLGMGGDFLFHDGPDSPPLPERYQFRAWFSDGSEVTASFWWFGHVHAVAGDGLEGHRLTASLGPSPLEADLTVDRFTLLVRGRPRRSVKSFLLDQKCLAGIGNVCVQDMLWQAKLHPLRPLGSLSIEEISALWHGMREVLLRGIELGGSAHEKDLHGRKGGWRVDEHFAVGYREGLPCPRCRTSVEKIRTGATSTFICPECQRL